VIDVATQQQDYGRVMPLMLPTTSLWKSYIADVVVNVVKQEWHKLVAVWEH
jgi:hypothetical protein